MVRKNSKKKLTLDEKKNQAGGSPAYKLHGNQGLLNQSSLRYNELPLGLKQNGFSDHIVATTGGGRRNFRRRSARKSKSLNKKKSRRFMALKSLFKSKSCNKRSSVRRSRSRSRSRR